MRPIETEDDLMIPTTRVTLRSPYDSLECQRMSVVAALVLTAVAMKIGFQAEFSPQRSELVVRWDLPEGRPLSEEEIETLHEKLGELWHHGSTSLEVFDEPYLDSEVFRMESDGMWTSPTFGKRHPKPLPRGRGRF
jgi:hypothetical protein